MDAARNGITELRALADLAASLGLRCGGHSFGPALGQAANLQVALSIANGDFFELPVPVGGLDIGVQAGLELDEDGFVRAPDGPRASGLNSTWTLSPHVASPSTDGGSVPGPPASRRPDSPRHPAGAGSLVSGGAKVDHGSGGTVPLRRSKTLPLWEPFPVTGRVGRFIPWSCIARSVWRAGTG